MIFVGWRRGKKKNLFDCLQVHELQHAENGPPPSPITLNSKLTLLFSEIKFFFSFLLLSKFTKSQFCRTKEKLSPFFGNLFGREKTKTQTCMLLSLWKKCNHRIVYYLASFIPQGSVTAEQVSASHFTYSLYSTIKTMDLLILIGVLVLLSVLILS